MPNMTSLRKPNIRSLSQRHTRTCVQNGTSFLTLSLALLTLIFSAGTIRAQEPCHDTLVHAYDTICEGRTYDFNGRTLTYSGTFFDTLPRVGTSCDSVIVLHLAILDNLDGVISASRICHGDIGYRISSIGEGYYYRWSAQPPDSSLADQQGQYQIHVTPQQPTTYNVYIDYRPTPQCPSTASVSVNPIEDVHAGMKISPPVLTYDNMELSIEDFSVGNREVHWGGGWSGRNWYLNGVRQNAIGEHVHFLIDPSWGDSITVLMEAYTPTCVDTAVQVIPFRKIALYIPNIFTPGQDRNNIFRPQAQGITDFELWLYDRRGILIFHSTDLTQGWDGTHRGLACPAGTYTYRCRYKDIDTPAGYQQTLGTVTLIR